MKKIIFYRASKALITKLLGIGLFALVFVTGTNAQANSILNKKLSISFNHVSLKEAFGQLEKKSGISMAYNSNMDALKQKVSAKYIDKTVKYILDDILKNKKLGYKIIDGKITIYETQNRKNAVNVSGYIYDAKTGEALIGCTVFNKATMQGAVSNNFGFYSLTLPNAELPVRIVFSFIGYEKKELSLTTGESKINIRLIPKNNTLDEVIVRQEKIRDKVSSTNIGTIKLKSTEINAIPAIGGEVDVLKAITLLPGIKQGVDGSSGFYVRGGGPDQNLILLDGVPLYNPYHLWGFLSTFNSDAINNMEITKGAFPARYGGRLSSVLDITMKEGNNQEWHTDFTLGLLSAKASVSGPIVKDKSSIMISARRTYLDLILVPINQLINSDEEYKTKQGYNFTDFNLKYNYKFSDKDRILVSGFFSKDKSYFKTESLNKGEEFNSTETIKNDKGWGNVIGSLRWNHLFGSKLFLNTTAYYTGYNYYTYDLYQAESSDTDIFPESKNSVDYSSIINDFSLKQDYQFMPNDKHDIRFGLGGIYHKFKPGVEYFYSKTGKETVDNKYKNNDISAGEFSLYFEDDYSLSRVIKFNVGVHASGFLVQEKFYPSIQPRLSMRFLVNPNFSIKAGYSSMVQYIHLLSSSGITQSSDLWVPSTAEIEPETSEQISLGIANLIKDEYLLEIDAYYKTMDNLLEYKDGASFYTTATGWEDKVAQGKGDAYGLEIFLKKTKGKFTGWLGYTLSWTNRKFDEINYGREFPYRYDRRHDVSLVGMYQLSEKWSLNASWVYYTGNAVSVPTVSYATPAYDGKFHSWSSFPAPFMTTGSEIGSSGIIESYGSRNNYRMPAYHRLDVSAKMKFSRPKSKHEFTFGVTNLYSRFNPSFYYSSHEQDIETGEAKLYYFQVTLFPIMPTVSYKISW
jgi:outer membrane cobalamin receptor